LTGAGFFLIQSFEDTLNPGGVMNTIKVWDIFVRAFHWSLVVAIITQLVTAEDAKSVHAIVGYFIVALLVLRIIWGFIGSKHARFKDFVYPPADILGYLKGLFQGRPKHYIGHNPAGGAMACLLLFTLVLTTLTGLLTYGSEGKGPFALQPASFVNSAAANDEHQRSDEDRDHHDSAEYDQKDQHGQGNLQSGHFWKELHETLVGFLLFLAGIHICGVIASSYVHKENLILAMFTGKKKVK
jgi:cytochrome b